MGTRISKKEEEKKKAAITVAVIEKNSKNYKNLKKKNS